MSMPLVPAGPRRALLAIATIAAAALPAPRALAADLDYGYGAVPPPVAESKVEFGSGWYVRGDIGVKDEANVVTLNRSSINTESFGVLNTSRLGYDLSLGGGYSFVNGFRADIVADFHQPTAVSQYNQACITTSAPTCSIYGKFASYDALVNGYYDVGTRYGITPYVGAGVGVGFGQANARLDGDPNGSYYANHGYHTFAFALMAGLAIDVYQHVKLDIGYRYLNNGHLPSLGGSIYAHEARLGVRYMIDN